MSAFHHILIRAAIEDDLLALPSADPAFINVLDDSGKTALFWALFRSGATTDDDPKTVAALLALGADPNLAIRRKSGELRSPLHQAAIRSLERVGRALVDAGARTDELGLLHAAAEGGQLWLVEHCLEHTPVNALHHGVTPMHDACYSGSEPLVRMLLERGADALLTVQGGDWAGLDNLHFAIIGNNVEVVRVVLERGVTATADHLRYLFAAERPWAAPPEEVEDAVAMLLGRDERCVPGAPIVEIASLFSTAIDGQTARAVAAETAVTGDERPRPEVAPMEVVGVDQLAGATELEWRRALHAAAVGDHPDLLRAYGRRVDVNMSCTGPVAMPPLCAAARLGNVAAVRALLECGADPQCRGADNKNAYRAALNRATRAVLRSLGSVW